MADTLSDPVRWTPDGLFYQARSLELRGEDRDAALERTFQGPLGAELRSRDPQRSGDPEWVRYNAQFYERRIALPPPRPPSSPVAGDRALLDLSVAGYVAAVLAIFGLLLLRFRLPIAAAVAFATVFLPALDGPFELSRSPTAGGWRSRPRRSRSGILALQRGPRWLIPWVASHPRPLVHPRQHLDPDRRGGMANPHVEVEGSLAAARYRGRRDAPR